MLSRRKFLLTALASAIAPTLSSCSNGNNTLSVKVLRDSIPSQLLGEFKKQFQLSRQFDLQPVSQLKDLYELLENAAQQEAVKIPNLVTLGDIWLKDAITEQLIQPLALNSLSNWQNLPSFWRKIGQRDSQGNFDPAGKTWGAPYRWGSTIIAYREDKFRNAGYDLPTDWGDLWREELRDRVSLLNQPREVIGLTLKKMGKSYNAENLDSIPNLKSELATLQQQVKFYSSQAYLQPLILGDTWLAVGWSSDALELRRRYPEIKTIIPKSGTALWADLWVNPTGNQALTEQISQWINFCWQLQAATQIGLFTNGSSPILLNTSSEKIPDSLQQDSLRIPSQALLEKSEFLFPLSPETEEQYQQRWQQMRTN